MLSRDKSCVWLARLAAVALLVGAAGLRDAAPAAAGGATLAEWTVLVYMAADNNLEGYALQNLQDMAAIGSSQQVRVAAQVARRATGHVAEGVLNLPDWTTTKRLYVAHQQLEEQADLGQVDMTNPAALRDFIIWGTRAFPAHHYALVLWDHGSAWQGFGADDTSTTGAPMPLSALADALRAGGVTFDMLGFDACLMASTEVALALQPFGKALVASEEVEPGLGWDYAAMLSALAENPAVGPLQLGRRIAESYLAANKAASPRKALYATLSVADLTQAPALRSALSTFAADLNRYVLGSGAGDQAEQLARLGQILGRARFDTPAFGRSAFNDPGYTFDLGILAANAATDTGDPAVTRSAAGVRSALERAVTFAAAGDGYAQVPLSGLSIYLPINKDIVESSGGAYASLGFVADTGWPQAIGAFAAAAKADHTPPAVPSPTVDGPAVQPGRSVATIAGQVTDETLVTGVVVGVLSLAGDQPLLVSFEEQPRSYQTVNDYSYRFDGLGWYLGDGANRQLALTVAWRPGQRAVFGAYRQTSGSAPRQAYLVFDEASGELVEAFDVVGGALGALLPTAVSQFQPFLYSLDQDAPIAGKAVSLQSARLGKEPLPVGGYLVTVIGFDIGGNTAAGSALVAVFGV